MTKADLRRAMQDAREYTRAVVDDLDDAQWQVPRLATVNPMLWEVGHLGWFMEHWCLRWRGAAAAPAPSLLTHADRWYDSRSVAHATRWELDLPTRAATWQYLGDVLDATLERLEQCDEDPQSLYFFQLALYHEDMHGEAFAYTRQTCSYAAPPPRVRDDPTRADVACGAGDVAVAAGVFEQGAPRAQPGFVFDNEKWAHAVALPAFAIAERPVTAGEFAAFVEDGGYTRAECWDDAGRRWLTASGVRHPACWRRRGGGWEERRHDQWLPLDVQAPVQHVNRHEAEAWCRWAGRRLPSESEWEAAAVAGRIAFGAVWEWTATPFRPYPGFQPDPYAEYSAPWFETHFSVRGASPATSPRVAHPRYRNYYTPERSDLFVGFRSCAL
jgi:gamma-glutamyl hercynylcysteine S-oxide synthase